MKFKFGHVVAGCALACSQLLAVSTAQAAPMQVVQQDAVWFFGGSDTSFSFDLGNGSFSSVSNLLKIQGPGNILAAELDIDSTFGGGIPFANSFGNFVLATPLTGPMTYFVNLTKTSASSQVFGTLTVSPVPEPETYALMLAGLGAIGFMLRRRNAG